MTKNDSVSSLKIYAAEIHAMVQAYDATREKGNSKPLNTD